MAKGSKGSSGPARSGGGISRNKLVHPRGKTGPPSTKKINPAGTAQLGTMVWSNPETLKAGTMSQVELGNANALKGIGVGGGRTVHRAGTQSATPPAIPI